MVKPNRIEVTSHIQWVRLDQMKINPQAQRALNEAWANKLADEFNPDLMGFVHVSHRDGWYYVIDGQHRVKAAIIFLGDSSQQVQCHVYEGLTNEQEAQLFLELNNTRTQGPMSKYKVALNGPSNKYPDEHDVERICRSLDLRVGLDKNCEEIGCISALLGVYRKHGPASFSFAMRVIRDAYGFDGFKRQTISALALIKDRYGDKIVEDKLVDRLSKTGIVELNRSAKSMKEATGNPADQCYAHSMIQFYNQRNAQCRVDPWWNLGVIGVA